MKKRILSMLLLVALLVTGIPVMAVSAADTASTASVPEDYAVLYVGAEKGPKPAGDGVELLGLFTAFQNDTADYDLAGGTWYNKVQGGKNATLVNPVAKWSTAANGGLTMGVTKDNYGKFNSTNSGIVFDEAWVDHSDFTVETVAVIYGIPEYTDSQGEFTTMQIDLLRGSHRPGLAWSESSGGDATILNKGFRLGVSWRANSTVAWYAAAREYSYRNAMLSTATDNDSALKEVGLSAGLTATYTKTTVGSGDAATVTYGVHYNTAERVTVTGESYTAAEYKSAVTAAPTERFRLFAKSAMNVYAVRAYKGLLTAEEICYNHLVDLLGFYQVAVPVDISAESLARVAVMFETASFVYDNNGVGDDHDTVKAALEQAVLADVADTDYASLYIGASKGPAPSVADGELLGLFTAFQNETNGYDLSSLTWYNKMDASRATDATLRDESTVLRWKSTAFGGLTAEVYSQSAWNGAGAKGAGIDLPLDWMSENNFTVEAMAVGRGYEAYKSDGTGTHMLGTNTLGDTFHIDVVRGAYSPAVNGGDGIRGYIIWNARCTTWYCMDGTGVERGRSIGFAYAMSNGGMTSGTVSAANYAPGGVTMSVTKAYDKTAGTFTYAATYNNGGNSNMCSSTGKNVYTQSQYNTATATAPKATRFTMFNRMAADVYAIRVYDYVLTEEEKQYNHLIDLFAFYQIELPEAFVGEAAKANYKDLAAAYYTYTMVYDNDSARGSADYDTVKAALEEEIERFTRYGVIAETDYTSYYVGAENGLALADGVKLVGLFTAFRNELRANATDLAAGKWTNRIATEAADDITLRDASGACEWSVGKMGNGGLTISGLDVTKTSIYQGQVAAIGMDLYDDWAGLDNFTIESAQLMYGLHAGVNEDRAETAITNMQLDMVHFHYNANLDRTDKTGGAGTWHGLTCSIWHTGGRDYAWRYLYDKNATTPAGETLIFTKATTHTGEGDSATYSVSYAYGHSNTGGGGQAGINGATYTQEQYEAALAAGKRDLRMFSGLPGDVYAIRVYDGLLTTAEKQYNHLIDLLGFYQVEISARVTAKDLATVASVYYDRTFVTDNNGTFHDYDVIKAELEVAMRRLDLAHGAPTTEYDELYVAQDHLVALHSAFGTDVSVDFAGGKWYTKVSDGASATLYEASASDALTFTAGANGGIHIGGVVHGNHTSAPEVIGIRLNDDYANLPNFTVETAAIMNVWEQESTYTGGGNYYHFRAGLMTGLFFPSTATTDTGAKLHFHYRASGDWDGTTWHMGARPAAVYDKWVETGVVVGFTEKMVKNYDAENDKITYGFAEGNKITYIADKTSSTSNGVTYEFKNAYTAAEHAARMAEVDPRVGWFSFFNGSNADVYAIRVYDKVLTSEEMAHNHLVDLLAFYGIEIPDHLNSAEWVALASAHGNTPFVKDDTVVEGKKELTYTGTKAKIEAAIDSFVTVVIDGEAETVFVPGGSYTLPAAIDGMTLFGWTDGATSVAPGTAVTVNGAVTYTALAVDAITVSDQVDATIIRDDDEMESTYAAIRFNAFVNKAQFQAMNAISGEGTMNLLEMGIIIVPKAYVDGAGAFTKAALEAWYAAEVGENKINREHTGAYLDLISVEKNLPTFRDGYDEDDTAFILSGGFADFSNATITHDPDFVAITYFVVDYSDEDREADNVIYGEYDPENVVSVYDVMVAKLATCTEGTTEYQIIDVIVDAMAERKTPAINIE